MNAVAVIISGIAGTATMTAFMYAMSFVTKRRMKVVKILGTTLTFQTNADGSLSDSSIAVSVGIIAHYTVGIIFTIGYALLWNVDIGRPDLTNGLILGVLSGFMAMVIWKLFVMLHPKPPALPLQSYLFTLFLAHIVFAVTVALVYRMLAEN